jgi:hypothetical protein
MVHFREKIRQLKKDQDKEKETKAVSAEPWEQPKKIFSLNLTKIIFPYTK